MDIFEEIGEIPVVSTFLDEPVPLMIVPAAQRVRSYLDGLFGAAWLTASVASYTLPGGETAHMVFTPIGRGTAMQLVYERMDGTFTLAVPVPSDDGQEAEEESGGGIGLLPAPDDTNAIEDERQCLAHIFPALLEASQIVAEADIPKRKKHRIRRELAHASKHLSDNLLRMRQMRREDEE